MGNTSSAIYGTPPLNDNDRDLITAFLRVRGAKVDPKQLQNGLSGVARAPPGYTYQWDHASVIVPAVLIAICALVTGIRVFIRACHSRLKLGWDDFFIVLGTIFALVFFALMLVLSKDGGAGEHIWDVTYVKVQKYFDYHYIGEIFAACGLGFIKISIVFFLRRLSTNIRRRWIIITDILLVICAGFTLVGLFVPIFRCYPASVSLDVKHAAYVDGPVGCASSTAANTARAAVSYLHCAIDVIIFIAAVAFLWELKLSTKLKIRVILVFSVGFVSVFASGMRVSSFSQAAVSTADFTYTGIWWLSVDLATGILVASLPTFNIFFKFRKTETYRNWTTTWHRDRDVEKGHRSNGMDTLHLETSNDIPDGAYAQPAQKDNMDVGDASKSVNDENSVKEKDHSVKEKEEH